MPSSPDGIGLYSKNSAVNHLHGNQVESIPIVVRATPLLLVHQRAVELLILPLDYSWNRPISSGPESVIETSPKANDSFPAIESSTL